MIGFSSYFFYHFAATHLCNQPTNKRTHPSAQMKRMTLKRIENNKIVNVWNVIKSCAAVKTLKKLRRLWWFLNENIINNVKAMDLNQSARSAVQTISFIIFELTCKQIRLACIHTSMLCQYIVRWWWWWRRRCCCVPRLKSELTKQSTRPNKNVEFKFTYWSIWNVLCSVVIHRFTNQWIWGATKKNECLDLSVKNIYFFAV